MHFTRSSFPALSRMPAVAMFALALAARGVAQVPNAPTVPDAAIIREPLTPATTQEVIEERPSPAHIWISGHYRWQDGQYAWVAGRWEVPPRAGLSWVDPRWERRANGYALTAGYWQDAGSAPVAGSAPPPQVVIQQPKPMAPSSAPVVVQQSAPVVVQPSQPQVVVIPPPGTPGAPAPTVVYVESAPPPPQVEYIVERPSPRHVWVGGYWSVRGGRHVWINGRWDLPPRSNVVWVEPRWERRGSRYAYVEGYWQEIVPPPPPRSTVSVGVTIGGGHGGVSLGVREVVVRDAPPPPRHEVRPGRPMPGHIWVSGYWGWRDGRHVWVEGHYERPPRSNAVWVEPRWEHRGGSYVFVEGVWR